MKALTPIPIAAPPIIISNNAIIINAILREISPQHTPLARGTQKQNLGSLIDNIFWLISSGLNR